MTVHLDRTAYIRAPAAVVFAHLDDFRNLAGHMAHGRSGRMGGGGLTLHELTPGPRGVGAAYRYTGRAFGLRMDFTQVVTEWTEGRRKAWRTREPARIIVLGRYAMGFDLEPDGPMTKVSAWIAYDLPRTPGGFVLGTLFARGYARWCLRSVLDGTRAALERPLQRSVATRAPAARGT